MWQPPVPEQDESAPEEVEPEQRQREQQAPVRPELLKLKVAPKAAPFAQSELHDDKEAKTHLQAGDGVECGEDWVLPARHQHHRKVGCQYRVRHGVCGDIHRAQDAERGLVHRPLRSRADPAVGQRRGDAAGAPAAMVTNGGKVGKRGCVDENEADAHERGQHQQVGQPRAKLPIHPEASAALKARVRGHDR